MLNRSLSDPATLMAETVVILGASVNPDRYSYRAQVALLENGHTPVPVNPKYERIEGVQCYPGLKSLKCRIDTVTVYVKPAILRSMTEDIIHAKPKRVIFNPGAESREVSARLEAAGIKVQNACTLILLSTNQFDD